MAKINARLYRPLPESDVLWKATGALNEEQLESKAASHREKCQQKKTCPSGPRHPPKAIDKRTF